MHMSIQPLEIPPQFSNQMGMGTPQAVFKGKVSLAGRIIFMVLFGLGAISAFLYALVYFLERFSRFYLPALLGDIAPFLIIGVIALAIAAGTAWGLYTRRKKAVVVYDNGFAYSDRKGVQIWKWEQLNQVFANVVKHYTNGIYTGTTHTYTFQNNEGARLVMNDQIKDIENLYNLIQKNSLQVRYQKLANAYNTGNPVVFGPVQIGKESGLQIGKKIYHWSEIEQVAINKGVLSVKKKDGGWFSGASATAGSIPNLHILLSILDQVVGLKTG